MGKAHRPWEELEGQRLRIDVGSTKEEALASQENSTIYFTKDKSIVMNGVAFSDGTAQHPVMVNVCRAIPTRPRKGQVYFFENRVFYRLHRDKMQDGETFSLSDCQIALGEQEWGWTYYQGLIQNLSRKAIGRQGNIRPRSSLSKININASCALRRTDLSASKVYCAL